MGKLNEFDLKDGNWKSYCDRLEMYFLVNSVKDDLKVPTLITHMGEEAYELLVNLCSPHKPSGLKFDEIVKLMSEHLQPRPSILAERFKFRQRRQLVDENISCYVAELKRLSRHCEFGSTLNENLRDQLACGIKSDIIRQRLFAEKDVTFTKAVSLASALEAAERDAAAVHGCGDAGGGTAGIGGTMASEASSTGVISRRSSTGAVNRMQVGACTACGDLRHTRSDCRFTSYECSRCRKVGHLRRVCRENLAVGEAAGRRGGRGRGAGRGQRARRWRPGAKVADRAETYWAEEDEEGHHETEEDDEPIYQMSLSQYRPVSIQVQVNNVLLPMEVDTGSPLSCIAYKTYTESFPQVPLQKCNLSIKFYNGSKVKPLGYLEVNVTYDKIVKKLDLYVFDTGTTSLLGRQWLAELNVRIPSINVNNVSIKKELSVSQRKELINNVICRYSEVFDDGLGCFTGGRASLELREGARPVFCRARPLPYSLRARVDAELNEMLRSGVIEPVASSDWATPLSSSSGSESDEWVEKKQSQPTTGSERDDWMSMTGMLKTYTKDDIKPKREEKKNNIDSYNPSTSVRELNPYWKDGGSGLPQTSDKLRRSRQFLKPDDDDNYYRKSSLSKDYETSRTPDDRSQRSRQSEHHRHDRPSRSDREPKYNWKRFSDSDVKTAITKRDSPPQRTEPSPSPSPKIVEIQTNDSLYMSDEKMNKLAAKVVKAEILGDTETLVKLKAKLEAAREYRKQNPNAGKEVDESVMLMSTSSSGNSRPLTNTAKGDANSKGGKRKAETHASGERTKYFGNDDKYNLAQMFEQEKYGTNYDDEAQLVNVISKHKNPNDDLEDIFVDDISKSRNEAKDRDREKQRAIKQHVKLERSMDGCEYCVDSKNMIKHLMVSCGDKVYLALPSKQSLVRGQCIITTIQHNVCVTSLDEDVWEEILNYRKALTQFYNSQGQDVVFFEIASRLHRYHHMVINCVPLPRDVGDMAAIYFKKALLECETEWSMNKKVVELKGKDVRKGVPKGLPYFWVDFGMESGFAHVIEDQHLFPRNFGEEIIGGMLDLDHHLWKNPRKEYGDLQRKKVLEFIKEWKPFEFNKK